MAPVQECELTPHVIVTTSPGRHQAHWRVKDLPLEEFENITRGIAKRFGGDPNIAELAHTCRLPGFDHAKDPDNRFQVRIIVFHDGPAYTPEQIRAAFLPVEKTAVDADAVSRRIDELAQLSIVEYDLQRKAAAKELGLRATTLDNEVDKRRGCNNLDAAASLLQPVEPWGKPVDGGALLGRLVETLRRHVVLPKQAPVAIALWVIHAHAHDASSYSPILVFTSPVMRCGKTTLLRALNKLVPKPLSSANVTPATMFRAIEAWHPTVLIDEADAFIKDKDDLRGILDSGHERTTASVLRCVGENMVPTQFSTWAPKVIALIGRLPPTLMDRAIKIELKRKMRSEHVERIPKRDDVFVKLKRKCARWAEDHFEALKVAEPDTPDELNDRARDNWEAMLAIADACGGDWPLQARAAALALSMEDDDETYGIQLLRDLQVMFAREPGKNLASEAIVFDLGQMADRPWPDFSRGQAITARGVAKLLKPFKILPRQVLVRGNRKAQGYKPEQFKWAFKRYLPVASECPDKPTKSKADIDKYPRIEKHQSEDKKPSNTLKNKGNHGIPRVKKGRPTP